MSDDKHYIVVGEIDTDTGLPEWDIEHPEGCPTVSIWDGMAVAYSCPVGSEVHMMGLDAFGYFGEWPEDIPREPGKYPIEFWETQNAGIFDFGEDYESGLKLKE